MRPTKSAPDTSNFWQNALSVAVLQTKSPTKQRFIFDTELNLPPWLRRRKADLLARLIGLARNQEAAGNSGDSRFRMPQNWSNSASLHRASLCHILRPGEASFFLSCQPLNDSHCCVRIPGTSEGRSCSFLLDSSAAKSIVNLQAFPTLCDRKEPCPLIKSPWLTQIPKDDADDICNAPFEAAVIPMGNLDDLCAQLTHIPNDERKELRQLLFKPIGQTLRGIPPPWRGDVNHLFEEMLRDEVIKPSKVPWAPPISLVKKKDSKLQLCID
ncbi:Gap Pol polyprotein [Echinococcus multilocularis]|uniref:Gap Pol polyprotein n=1 Tax=Echinococcus multilocularis TaxID=6211 RepID=A0A068XZA8_ECHMU|nr:Gap Pol polyprotein [Echinococcus multilocularis]